MRILNMWNKLSDIIVDILKVASLLLIPISVVFIVINLITGINDDMYKYCLMGVSMTFLNTKVNGG